MGDDQASLLTVKLRQIYGLESVFVLNNIAKSSVALAVIRTLALMCSAFMIGCTDDDTDRNTQSAVIGNCAIAGTGPVREVSFGQAVNTATCKLQGFSSEVEAAASLRAAGVCPLQIETRKNPNNGFPCEAFGPPNYFIAKISVTHLPLAVDAGWSDPYSKVAINNRAYYNEFLINRRSALELNTTPPDCDCTTKEAETCGELYDQCVEYLTDSSIDNEIQIEIDQIDDYLRVAREITGAPVSCDEYDLVDLKINQVDIEGIWGNDAPFVLDTSSYRTERRFTLKPDSSFEKIEHYYFKRKEDAPDRDATRYQCPKGIESALCSMWRSKQRVNKGTYSLESNVITLRYADEGLMRGMKEERYHINRLPDQSLRLLFGAACQVAFQRQ